MKTNKLPKGFYNARYRLIPCWYNLETSELIGTNWVYDMLISFNLWIDTEILMVEEYPIKILIDNEIKSKGNTAD